jgi:dTDP-L-rhamnose 4-epimerase
MKILVTGGAGFIGSHIVDNLVQQHEHEVVILDNLDPQVHKEKPDYLNPNAEFIQGDVRNKQDLKRAMEGCEAVFHEAAAVGVGQSMYQIKHYTEVNTFGTSLLLDMLVNEEHSVKKLIVASSMSAYGEGIYKCPDCGLIKPKLRTEKQMKQNKWEIICSCGKTAIPVPTPESKPQQPTSVYALSKMDQEKLCLMIGKTYGIPTVALRYFNVYGPRQSLSNPYTGVTAIFMSRLKNNNPVVIYEDGLQTRDFISVHDIAKANIHALNNSNCNYNVYNVGSGIARSIKEIAETLKRLTQSNAEIQITGEFRKGDIRHCFADITKLKATGWEPEISFERGMQELLDWSANAEADDKFEQARKELEDKGLMVEKP